LYLYQHYLSLLLDSSSELPLTFSGHRSASEVGTAISDVWLRGTVK